MKIDLKAGITLHRIKDGTNGTNGEDGMSFRFAWEFPEGSPYYEGALRDEYYNTARAGWNINVPRSVQSGAKVGDLCFFYHQAADTLNTYQGIFRIVGQNPDPTSPNINVSCLNSWCVRRGEKGQPGLRGLQGKDGTDGIPGKDGTDGKTSYFHIKYSNLPNPTLPEQIMETPSVYIGTYVDFEEKDSTDPLRYTWHRFEGLQGADGQDGLPGKNGTDGKTSYLHIKYSDDGRTFTANDGETPGDYIGTYTDHEKRDSMEFAKYTWKKIKGEQGEQGPQGPQGAGDGFAFGADDYYTEQQLESFFAIGLQDDWEPAKYGDFPVPDSLRTGDFVLMTFRAKDTKNVHFCRAKVLRFNADRKWLTLLNVMHNVVPSGPQGVPGEDGSSFYTWIKYADTPSGGGMSDNPSGKKYIGLAHNKTTATESSNPSDYRWSLIKGEDGVPGEDGTYTWIRYSEWPDGQEMTQQPNARTRYIGIRTAQSTASESNNPADYVWSLFSGQGLMANLLRGTGFDDYTAAGAFHTQIGIIVNKAYRGINAWKVKSTDGEYDAAGDKDFLTQNVEIRSGAWYTYSFLMKGSPILTAFWSLNRGFVAAEGGTGYVDGRRIVMNGSAQREWDGSTDFVRHSFTFQANFTGLVRFIFRHRRSRNPEETQICCIKLEENTDVTAWERHYEDTAARPAGRNLLLGSTLEPQYKGKWIGYHTKLGYSTSEGGHDGHGYAVIQFVGGSSTSDLIRQRVKVHGGAWYTLSFYYKGDGVGTYLYTGNSGATVKPEFYHGGVMSSDNLPGDGYHYWEKTPDWKRCTLTFQVASGVNELFVLWRYMGSELTSKIFLSCVKLERGKNATPWCLAEEDLKGENGQPGAPGKVYRRTLWQEGKQYYDGTRADDYGLYYIDIAAIPSEAVAGGYRYFICRSTHTSHSNSRPGNGGSLWQELSTQTPLFAPLIVADDAVFKFNQTNKLIVTNNGHNVVGGMQGVASEDGTMLWVGATDTNVPNAPFAVNGRGEMKAEKGTVGGWNITRGALSSPDGTIVMDAASGTMVTNGFNLARPTIVNLSTASALYADRSTNRISLFKAGRFIVFEKLNVALEGYTPKLMTLDFPSANISEKNFYNAAQYVGNTVMVVNNDQNGHTLHITGRFSKALNGTGVVMYLDIAKNEAVQLQCIFANRAVFWRYYKERNSVDFEVGKPVLPKPWEDYEKA